MKKSKEHGRKTNTTKQKDNLASENNYLTRVDNDSIVLSNMETGVINLLLESNSYDFQYADYGLTPESTNEEVVSALQANILENYGFNLEEAIQDGSYIIKHADNSNNTYIFPKSTAGYLTK